MGKTNVFGQPITSGTRPERAYKALLDPNGGDKYDQAIAYVRKQKAEHGHGTSTLCVFYNATGETLTYNQDHSWAGKVYDSYPAIVKNGQWGAYLHVKKALVPSGSVGAVEYRGKFRNTEYCKQLISWDTPWNQITQDNHAYSEIYEDDKSPDWDEVLNKVEASGRQHVAKWNGMLTKSTTEEASSPLYEVVLTIEDLVTAAARARAANAETEPYN